MRLEHSDGHQYFLIRCISVRDILPGVRAWAVEINGLVGKRSNPFRLSG
jgi:hypothetical protein